jgi:chemotaxis family two-component system response regulator Rcp1
VLREVKADQRLKGIPIVVMTTSNSPADIMEAYATGAACYVTKPEDFESLKEFARNFFEFWRMAEYPAAPDAANPLRGSRA